MEWGMACYSLKRTHFAIGLCPGCRSAIYRETVKRIHWMSFCFSFCFFGLIRWALRTFLISLCLLQLHNTILVIATPKTWPANSKYDSTELTRAKCKTKHNKYPKISKPSVTFYLWPKRRLVISTYYSGNSWYLSWYRDCIFSFRQPRTDACMCELVAERFDLIIGPRLKNRLNLSNASCFMVVLGVGESIVASAMKGLGVSILAPLTSDRMFRLRIWKIWLNPPRECHIFRLIYSLARKSFSKSPKG